MMEKKIKREIASINPGLGKKFQGNVESYVAIEIYIIKLPLYKISGWRFCSLDGFVIIPPYLENMCIFSSHKDTLGIIITKQMLCLGNHSFIELEGISDVV